ncbi:MAG: hypothetical protein ABI860_11880 [Gemmatimonadales bacterium]
MRFPRGIATALLVSMGAGCQGRDPSPRTDAGVARDQVPHAAATASPASAPSVAWRVIGTEPFWGLDIDSTGLRFTTPEDATGIRWPPVAPMVRGDTSRWVARTERAGLDARIWAARCSDGMSDRVWPATAVVRVGDTSYRGCAESRAPSTATSAVEGNWRLFVKGPGVLLTAWDGVFFELRRE